MLLFAIRCLSDVIVLSCSLPHVFFPPWRGATYSMHGFYDHFNNLLFRNSQNTYIYIYIYIYTRDVHIVHNTHNTCINIIHTHPLCMLLRICTNHIYIYIYTMLSPSTVQLWARRRVLNMYRHTHKYNTCINIITTIYIYIYI